jgi:adenylate cyclase
LNEALEELKRAQKLDPTSIIVNAGLGQTLYHLRRWDEAIEQLRNTLEMDPAFVVPHYLLGLVYIQKQNPQAAKGEFETAVKLSNGAPNLLALLGAANGKTSNKREAQKILDELTEMVRQKRAQPHDLAIIYTGLNDKARAIEWLEKAYAERSWLVLLLKVDPFFDPLRSDPRFETILRNAGLA